MSIALIQMSPKLCLIIQPSLSKRTFTVRKNISPALDKEMLTDGSLRDWRFNAAAQSSGDLASVLPRHNICVPHFDMGASRIPKRCAYQLRYANKRYGSTARAICECRRQDISPLSGWMERRCELVLLLKPLNLRRSTFSSLRRFALRMHANTSFRDPAFPNYFPYCKMSLLESHQS